ncbi:hypothetical protein [Bordetella trematum]|uniref:hypothetical protein n=1 Tax=Bordetella trematum TaxID=123899 RepID=UPI000ADB3AA8|nr:hypothetical protein [Bordetella trematum]
MSKTSKFFKHPVLFFKDAYKKKQGGKGLEILVVAEKKDEKANAALAVPMPSIATKNSGSQPIVMPSTINDKAAAPKPKAPTTVAKQPVALGAPQGPRPQSFYLETILDLKRGAPVNMLTYKDYCLWPALRSELMIQCDIAWKKGIKNETSFNPYQSQLCRPANVSFEKGEELKASFDYFKRVEDIEKDSCDFLFFSNLNSTDHVDIGGRIYNRLVDPLFEAASQVGKAKKIEVIKAASPAIEKIKRYHNVPLCIVPPYIYRAGYSDAIRMPKNFHGVLQSKIPFIKFTEDRLVSFFDWHLHMLDFYRDLLDKLNPKVVFFHPFYYYTPLIAAARERGIKTVDIQHGVMIGYNTVFYSNWQETPETGYLGMPDYFLVWSENERNHLERTFSDNFKASPHRAVVSGYAWLDYAVVHSEKAIARLGRVKNFVEKGKIAILVTLQRDSLIPKNVEQIIDTSDDSVRWIIRRHPKGEVFNSDVRKKKNVLWGSDVDLAELRDIFKCVNYNFTDGSSTVLEADYFDVYSFVYGKEGIMNYKELIDSGKVGIIPPNVQSFDDLQIGSEDSSQRIGYFKKHDLTALLEKILVE